MRGSRSPELSSARVARTIAPCCLTPKVTGVQISREVLRETNDALRGDDREIPPRCVTAGVLTLTGGTPPALGSATITRSDRETKWEVWACTDIVLVRVHAEKAVSDWAGGTHEDDGNGETLHAESWRIADLGPSRLSNPATRHGENGEGVMVFDWIFVHQRGGLITLSGGDHWERRQGLAAIGAAVHSRILGLTTTGQLDN